MSEFLRNPIEIDNIVLTDGAMRVSMLSYGATTQGWWYKDVPMILGYDNPQDYITDKNYLGAIVGRVANRIGGARFDLENVRYELDANEGRNTLHGGRAGLSHQNWGAEQISASEAVFRLMSPEGDSGFPGTVEFELRVQLDAPRLVYSVFAQPDRPTPISVAQHNYYSLGSTIGISEHRLIFASNRYLGLNQQGVPLGAVMDVSEDGLDFTSAKAVKEVSPELDAYFLFDSPRDYDHPVAELTAPSGLKMTVRSDQPGAQVYAGGQLTDPFHKGAGLCIEPSGYPNAPNVPTFPSIIYTPERPYRQSLVLEISEEKP